MKNISRAIRRLMAWREENPGRRDWSVESVYIDKGFRVYFNTAKCGDAIGCTFYRDALPGDDLLAIVQDAIREAGEWEAA